MPVFLFIYYILSNTYYYYITYSFKHVSTFFFVYIWYYVLMKSCLNGKYHAAATVSFKLSVCFISKGYHMQMYNIALIK